MMDGQVHDVALPVRPLWWRSAGNTHTACVMETMMDRLARAANQDPLAFRLALLQKNARAARTLGLVADKAGWGKAMPPGTAQGIALGALYYSETDLKAGRPQQRNLDQYRSLRIHEMPAIEVFIADSSAPPTGVGEPGVPPLAPDVANAVVRAGRPDVPRLPFARAGLVQA